MAAAKKSRFSAVTEAGYHYPDGFICLGEAVQLNDEEAERGLASGQLAPTPEPPKPAPKVPKNEES